MIAVKSEKMVEVAVAIDVEDQREADMIRTKYIFPLLTIFNFQYRR